MADGVASGDIAPERLIGERIAGRFVVERLIGRGELSTAFRAHDDRLHRRVTVKLFHPRHRDDVQVVESQLAAARAVARLSHEHVAMVIDRGEHEGMPLIVLEHVRGENLHERIERYAPLAVGEVVRYSLQIARALAYAHGHGVVHGNLRPGNVLLTEERDVKLVDFGGGSYVAQLVGDPFAAPELREVDADAPPEPSDDIFALGALAFVALTEQAPRPGLEPSELQLLRPDVSARLAGTIARSLARNPEDRHLSMRELAAELSAVRESADAPVDAGSGEHDRHDQSTQSWSIDDQDDADEATADGTAILPRTAGGDVELHPLRSDGPQARPRRRRRDPKRSRTPREARARILAWSMVVAPLAALVIFGLMIAGERGSDQVTSDGGATGGPISAVPVASVVSFDPRPGGDGSEHEDETANIIDGQRDTIWQTEGYATMSFSGGTKPGVGIVLQLEDEADVREVQIATDLPGWIVDVRTSDVPASTLAAWRIASEATPVKDNIRIPVDKRGAGSRFVLLWVTQLAIDPNDANSARARISEVKVFASDDQQS
jgi:serine/threonine-protein kinase